MRNAPTFGLDIDKVVEYGIARLRDEHNGEIIEPLSVLRWLESQQHHLEFNIRLRLGSWNSRGRAFEQLVLLYLVQILRDPVPLNTIFDFHGNPPEWADELAQVVGRLAGINVPVDVLGERPDNPGLGVVHYVESIKDIVCWIDNPYTAPAVLIPGDNFGPDVMIRCKLSSSMTLFIMAQLKCVIKGNKTCLDARSMTNALTLLHEDHWFKREVCYY
jgi:hypothetical protein